MTAPTEPPPPDARELALHDLIERGEIDQATERTIRLYGPELIAWLCAMCPGEADAYDAFSRMSEELWRSLRRFDRRCSLRTWCYMLARQAAYRVRVQPSSQREVLLATVPSLLGAVTHVWSTSRGVEHQVQNVYAEIRRELDDDEQALLVLRVDRNLAWRDIAIVLLGEEAEPDAVSRRAAALRKQFERVKERLRELAAKKLGR